MNSDSDATDAGSFTRIEYIEVIVDGETYPLATKKGREVPLPERNPELTEKSNG